MKQAIILAATLLVSITSFAGTPSLGFSKNSPQLKALGSAWNSNQSVKPALTQNDITIVYGGADISRRPTTISHIATV